MTPALERFDGQLVRTTSSQGDVVHIVGDETGAALCKSAGERTRAVSASVARRAGWRLCEVCEAKLDGGWR